jgi:hypothetical protein
MDKTKELSKIVTIFRISFLLDPYTYSFDILRG